jgi:FO synthase subunit 1
MYFLYYLFRYARQILPHNVSIQVPPNLVAPVVKNRINDDNDNDTDKDINDDDNDFLISLLDAGVTDLGGISLLDEVNPNYDFQKIDKLKSRLHKKGYKLVKRLPVYSRFIPQLSDRVRSVINENYCGTYA